MNNYSVIFEITDKVVSGNGLGSTIDMPTINFLIDETKYVDLPDYGVYGSVVILPDGSQKYGVSNLGLCPTVSSSQECRLETHILDFNEDLYDKTITVKLVKFIRETRKFDSLEQLKDQVDIDKNWY